MNRAFPAIIATLSILFAAQADAATKQTTVTYKCDEGSATAVYDTSSPQGGAIVTYGGNTIAFQSAMSGSGARYTTASGPRAIAPLEWWTKGPNATLSELSSTANGTNRLIATCTQVR